MTPTLIDMRAGTIKWTGTPADVTLDDPFTAQGAIATDVAQAMEVAVLPAERAQLKRRFTDNPQAFAAYQRAQEIINASAREGSDMDPQVNQNAIRELNTAIALDSNFAEAWGALARRHFLAAVNYFGDSADFKRSRAVLTRALRRAPSDPTALLASALWAWSIDGSRQMAESLTTKALSISRNDAATLAIASDVLGIWHPDSAQRLAVRAARLDPRSARNLQRAAHSSLRVNRSIEARRFGEQIVALDSADERGWRILLSVQVLRGDTIALQQISGRIVRNVNRPSIQLACFMAMGSQKLSAWYLSLSTVAQNVNSLRDSVWYYDCKTDSARRVHGDSLSRVYSDSILALLSPSRMASLPTPSFASELTMLGYAHANRGNRSAALALAARIVKEERQITGEDYLVSRIEADAVASIYAASGDTASAIRWLAAGIKQGFTVGWYKMDPRLRPLHGTPAFERFVRENDHRSP